MKIKLLIILVIVAITVSVFTVMKYNELTETPKDSSFNYKKTELVTDETFLSKNVKEWQEVSFDELMNYNENYGTRDFFGDLGQLLIKNEMLFQLRMKNIVNANDDFQVYSSKALTSLPPHVSFEAVVNGTDGNSYRLQGTTFANSVSNVNISNLVFYDTDEQLPIESIIHQNQIVKILPQNEYGPQVDPFDLVIDGDMNDIVGFENNLITPIQILGGGDYQYPTWTGPIILPYGKGTLTFNNTGIFEWSAHSLPLLGNGWREGYGNGEINVISNETSSLPLSVKGKIAGAIIKNSEIPWSGIGTRADGLYIEFNQAIFDMLPDAKEYYTARAEQLVPFDMPIIVEEPHIIVDSDILR